MRPRAPKPHVIEVGEALIYEARRHGLRDPVWALLFAACTLSLRNGHTLAGLIQRMMRAKTSAELVEREREAG